MNDIVENRVNGTAPDEVIAVHVILLADAVGAVFALTAIGIRPRKFHKGHIRGRCECQTDTGSFDGADYQLSFAGLKRIDSSLFLGKAIIAGDTDGIGELLLQSLDNLFGVSRTQSKGLPLARKLRIKSVACFTLPLEARERRVMNFTRASMRILRRMSRSVHSVYSRR